jgi:hypothetical protein
MANIVEESRKLMRKQTLKNRSPAWLLTELAVAKGRELSRKYKVDERLVCASLYLAHTVFDREVNGPVQRRHPQLSSCFAKRHLDRWGVAAKEKGIILNSIEAHHAKVPTKSLTAEVVKNAECFKFVTLKGCLILLHEEGLRGVRLEDSVDYVLYKMNQKRKLLTLKDCITEANRNCRKIEEVFGVFKESPATQKRRRSL